MLGSCVRMCVQNSSFHFFGSTVCALALIVVVFNFLNYLTFKHHLVIVVFTWHMLLLLSNDISQVKTFQTFDAMI